MSTTQTLLLAIAATTILSLISLSGALLLGIKPKKLKHIVLWLVALSAGTMLGASFFHLLPELMEIADPLMVFGGVAISFVGFWLIERGLHWRHCHEEDCTEHSFGMMNLIGDGVHNLLDGLMIGASFATSPELGIVTTAAMALHEIPQEIGDFGVLLHAGWPAKKALLANLGVALTSVIGAILGVMLSVYSDVMGTIITVMAAGGFIYIAASDLVPELKKEKTSKLDVGVLSFFIIGLGIMWVTAFYE